MRTIRTTALTVAAAAAVALAPFSFDHPAAQAAPAAAPAAATHVKHPQEVTRGQLISRRNATAADVASGFAASTASSVVTCAGHVHMNNPYTGYYTNYLQMYLGWQESKDANGTPEARINNSTAIVLHNESNAGTTAVFFRDADWLSTSAGNFALAAARNNWYAGAPQIVKGGQQLGMKVQADGNVDESTNLWINALHKNWGFRQFLAYNPNAGAWPELFITLEKGTDGTDPLGSEIRIYADGACGDLILY